MAMFWNRPLASKSFADIVLVLIIVCPACERRTSDHGKITPLDREAAKLPVEPTWWNAIREGQKLGFCTDIITVTLTAAASVQGSIFVTSLRHASVADEARSRFACPTSDHIAQLNAVHTYVHLKRAEFDMDLWCLKYFIDGKVMEQVLEIRYQLLPLVTRLIKGAEHDLAVRRLYKVELDDVEVHRQKPKHLYCKTRVFVLAAAAVVVVLIVVVVVVDDDDVAVAVAVAVAVVVAAVVMWW